LPRSYRYVPQQRLAQSRTLRITVPVEGQRTARTQAPGNTHDTELVQPLRHEQGVLIDEERIAVALDDQIAHEGAVANRTIGCEHGREAMLAAELAYQRKRRWHFRDRRRM